MNMQCNLIYQVKFSERTVFSPEPSFILLLSSILHAIPFQKDQWQLQPLFMAILTHQHDSLYHNALLDHFV